MHIYSKIQGVGEYFTNKLGYYFPVTPWRFCAHFLPLPCEGGVEDFLHYYSLYYIILYFVLFVSSSEQVHLHSDRLQFLVFQSQKKLFWKRSYFIAYFVFLSVQFILFNIIKGIFDFVTYFVSPTLYNALEIFNF